MQSLAGYGSGSDDEDERPAALAAPAPMAGPSKLAAQAPAHLSAASPAPPAALNRIKGAASRGQSPLTGVRLPTSSSNSPRPPPSPAALGKRRDSSHSPPPFARAEPASAADHDERTSENGIAGVQLDTLAEFGIPPVPTGPSKASVEAKLANFHNLRLSRGLHFNDSLHASKAFRNPRIYAKLVEFLDVDETGSNWDREVWDSKEIGADAAASRIAELQKIRSEAKSSGQLSGSRSSIAFTSSRDDRSSSSRGGGSGAGRDDRDRGSRGGGGGKDGGKRSRWDRERSRSPRRR